MISGGLQPGSPETHVMRGYSLDNDNNGDPRPLGFVAGCLGPSTLERINSNNIILSDEIG